MFNSAISAICPYSWSQKYTSLQNLKWISRPFTDMNRFYFQHGKVITSIIKQFQTTKVVILKFSKGRSNFTPHIFGIWLFIHDGIEVKPMLVKGIQMCHFSAWHDFHAGSSCHQSGNIAMYTCISRYWFLWHTTEILDCLVLGTF